jgi:hypothetical protein
MRHARTAKDACSHEEVSQGRLTCRLSGERSESG